MGAPWSDCGGYWAPGSLFYWVGMPRAVFENTNRLCPSFFSSFFLVFFFLLFFYYSFSLSLSFSFFYDLLLYYFFIYVKLPKKWKSKLQKGVRLSPKKCFFKVKNLTMLLCALGIGKHMDDNFVNKVVHKLRLEPFSIYLKCIGGFTSYVYCTMRMNLDDLKWSRPPGF